MWTNRVLMCGIDILLCLWAVYLFFFYFDIFFARKRKRYLSVIGITLFVIWQFGITTIISFPAYINIAVTIMFTFLAVMMTYEGRWWNKGVFVITFNAIWMLMETLCNYILITYCPQYAAVRQVGSFVSKIFFNAVILALKKVFTDDDIKELPVRYSILLVLIPTGSIYIMNNIFMLGFANNTGRTRINSTFTVLILLGMNILIFYVYMKLADDLRLRRMAAVYEQQLELCERHQQERELSMLQLRDIKHNMKNNLISILAYAENKEYEKMTGFIEEIMGEGGMVIASIYPLELFVAWGIILVSSICIWKLSPVENINHELEREEKEHCRKVTGKILGVILIAAGCCTTLGMKKYISLIALTALTVFISQCIGIIKYKVEKEKN